MCYEFDPNSEQIIHNLNTKINSSAGRNPIVHLLYTATVTLGAATCSTRLGLISFQESMYTAVISVNKVILIVQTHLTESFTVFRLTSLDFRR